MPTTRGLELIGIDKSFGTVRALDEVSLEFAPGEIHALLGENGAGKSTLVAIACGELPADAGTVRVDGADLGCFDRARARRLGIGAVHQHFRLVEAFTVAENLALESAPRLLSRRLLNRRARESMERHRLSVDPNARLGDLSIGERQRVEILKALQSAGRVLFLDEPTAALAPAEVEVLLGQIDDLRRSGLAIVWITHRLKEVRATADRVSVLAHGRVVLSERVDKVGDLELARLLLAGSGSDERAADPHGVDEPPLTAAEHSGRKLRFVGRIQRLEGDGFGPVDLDLISHRVTAIAGIPGNGQEPLVETLVGLRQARAGQFRVEPGTRRGFLSGDRHGTALALDLSVAENTLLKRSLLARPWIAPRLLAQQAEPLLRRYSVRFRSHDQPVGELSGGNQQRIVAARELEGAPDLILAQDPTRGLDLAATAQLRRELRKAADAGAAVLLVTSDLDEVLELADIVYVAWRGRLSACAHDEGALSAAMTGAI